MWEPEFCEVKECDSELTSRSGPKGTEIGDSTQRLPMTDTLPLRLEISSGKHSIFIRHVLDTLLFADTVSEGGSHDTGLRVGNRGVR